MENICAWHNVKFWEDKRVVGSGKKGEPEHREQSRGGAMRAGQGRAELHRTWTAGRRCLKVTEQHGAGLCCFQSDLGAGIRSLPLHCVYHTWHWGAEDASRVTARGIWTKAPLQQRNEVLKSPSSKETNSFGQQFDGCTHEPPC